MASPADEKFPLHAAARLGHLPIIESLHSANPKLLTQRDDDDRLPLHWAASYNHAEIVRFIASQRSFDPDAIDGSGWTPLMMAASLKDNAGLGIVEFLLGQKEADPKLASNSGATALHFAVSKGNLEVVKTLLSGGASARFKDKRGQLPLHRAAAVGSVPIVKLLLGPEGKSPANASDMDGMTALHHAVSEGHGDVAVELMRQGAEVGRVDGEGRTALALAPDKKVRDFVVAAAEREGVDLEGA